MNLKMPATPTWLRASVKKSPIGVDRENNVIRGYVVAQRGPFKSEGRGEFDDEGLELIVEQMNAKPAGVKSRFAHPSLSGDGIGSFLGRARNARQDDESVRADLHIDKTALDEPIGGGKPRGQYVMDLAESDPEAFGSSLVLQVNQKFRLDDKGFRKKGEDGADLPPLWYPTAIHASDVVDDGDAVHSGFLSHDLSARELPDFAVREGFQILSKLFPGQPREVVETRCLAWLKRALDLRYGPQGQSTRALRARLAEREKVLARLGANR